MTEKELYGLLESVKNTESEIIEFKEWKNNIPFMSSSDQKCVYSYCDGIGNEGGGKLVIGINDKGQIRGTNADFPKNSEKSIYDKTGQKILIEEVETCIYGKL